jgi:ABC-type glycerol-3-phosphate transport system substrate-binding protein
VFKHKISDAPPKALPDGFAGGFYAMHNFIHTGTWPGYTAAGLTWDIMIPPKGKRRDGGELAFSSTAMGKGTKLAEEAWTFMRWHSGEGGCRQYVKMGFPPIRKSVAEATWLAKKDTPPMPLHPERYFDALPYNMIVFAPPGSWDIWQVLQKYVEMFWDQKITPEEACKKAAEEFRKVIASG